MDAHEQFLRAIKSLSGKQRGPGKEGQCQVHLIRTLSGFFVISFFLARRFFVWTWAGASRWDFYYTYSS